MQRDPFYCYFKVHLKVQRAESGSGRGLGYSLFCGSSGLRVSAEGRCGSGQNGSASKDRDPQECGPKEDRPLEMGGAGQHGMSASLQDPLSFYSTVQSWHHPDGQRQLREPSLRLLPESALLKQVFLLLSASAALEASWALTGSPDGLLVPGWRARAQAQSCSLGCIHCLELRKLLSCPTSLLSL